MRRLAACVSNRYAMISAVKNVAVRTGSVTSRKLNTGGNQTPPKRRASIIMYSCAPQSAYNHVVTTACQERIVVCVVVRIDYSINPMTKYWLSGDVTCAGIFTRAPFRVISVDGDTGYMYAFFLSSSRTTRPPDGVRMFAAASSLKSTKKLLGRWRARSVRLSVFACHT